VAALNRFDAAEVTALVKVLKYVIVVPAVGALIPDPDPDW
jgi:hypothetical protein